MLKTYCCHVNFNVVKTPVFQGFSTLSTEFSTMGEVFNSQQTVISALLFVFFEVLVNLLFFYADKKYILYTGEQQ